MTPEQIAEGRRLVETGGLLPCPFCGNEPCDKVQRRRNGNDTATLHFVMCGTCEAEGAPYYADAEAVAAWNRRSLADSRGKKCEALQAEVESRGRAVETCMQIIEQHAPVVDANVRATIAEIRAALAAGGGE